MKTKDYIFIGLATVISLVIYFFSIMVSSIGGRLVTAYPQGFWIIIWNHICLY